MSLYNATVRPTPVTRSQKWKTIYAMGFIRERIALKDAMRFSTVVEQRAYKNFIKSLGVPKDLNYKKQRAFLSTVVDAIHKKESSKIEILKVAPHAWKEFKSKK